MSETKIINSETSLAEVLHEIGNIWRENKYIEIEITRKAKQRTLTQNKAMHLFFGWLATALNDAGYDMRRTLRHDVDIPWTVGSVKDHLWRPIQVALTGKQSTVDATTIEPTEIHAVLSRHLGERLGVVCPAWPIKDDAQDSACKKHKHGE